MTGTEALLAVVVAVGLVGILVPVLPGSILVLAAVLVWALTVSSATGWVVLAVAAALLGAGAVVKYVVPGRRLAEAGVPARTQWIGALVGVVGFFVMPIVGLPLGFVLGVYASERQRVGPLAWTSTRAALRAVGLSILIEMLAALLATGVWVAGVLAT